MSTTGWAIAGAAAGGVLEVLGVLAVVLEIRRDREHARGLLRYVPGYQPPRRHYPMRRSTSVPGNLRMRSRSTDAVSGLYVEVHNVVIELAKRMDECDDDLAEELVEVIVEGDNELRDNLREALTGSARWRLIGVGLLLAGIALTTAGGVLGALA